ncbi:NADH-quinone oxidoreductase subunit NuoH [Buchnera aphidicola (Ceratoglyphina bambusae)]|uniref:NADH-quinone oxidoreductase subunit NuoH n=1 Tax=Buchnera aphidicola TaxID=9 RepID=UPI0031B7FA42
MSILFNYVKIFFVIFLIMCLGAFLSILERRILALLQNRHGPNRVGWNGCLQIFADMIKILFKEDWIPPFSKKFIFFVSPIFSFCISLLMFFTITISNEYKMLDLNIGILFFLMLVSLSVYSILFAGISSNNKYSLLGSIRSIAQTLSYEIFLGISIMSIVIKSNSCNVNDIIIDQKHLWNVIPQFINFCIFFIASLAVCHRHPFDQPESEQELADGYHIEYSGMKFGIFFISEYISIFSISAFITCIFFGGYLGIDSYPIFCFLIKTFLLIFLFILVRASLPRPRYDQVVSFGWKFCFPVSLLNLFGTAFFNLILY